MDAASTAAERRMTMTCPDCGNMIAYNSYFSAFYCPRCGGIFKKVKPMTNADRIRAMSDEELSVWIASMTTVCECCAEINECESPKCFNKCLHGVEDWLKQPPKGESNNE